MFAKFLRLKGTGEPQFRPATADYCSTLSVGIRAGALLAFGSAFSLSRQHVEQRFRILQVGGIEALVEPAVNFSKHRARFVTLAVLLENTG